MHRGSILMAALLGGIILACPAWPAGLEEPFIINDVRTRVGQAFYRGFCTVWNTMEGLPVRDIIITEEPGARASSQLRVLVGGSVAYVGFLSQRSTDIRAEVDRAVALSFRYIFQSATGPEDIAPELYGPDIGSGI